MLHVEVVGRTLVLTLDRPEARNAINAATAAELEAGIDRLESTTTTSGSGSCTTRARCSRPVPT